MSDLGRSFRRPPARCPDAERTAEGDVFLDILKTADILQTELAEALKPADLSPTQYNVLRILRDAGPGGLACGKIAGRMLTHDPDITRLLDRLEKRGLIDRSRDVADRRVVRAHLTQGGWSILAGLDKPVHDLHLAQLSHLGPKRLKSLTALLQKARERTS